MMPFVSDPVVLDLLSTVLAGGAPPVDGAVDVLSREAVTAGGILAIVVLIGLSAFFASSEIAIFSLGNHRVSALVEEGARGARTLEALKSKPRRLLVTILVGNNIANIAMSSIATGLLGMYFDGGQAVLIATFGITSIVLLFGESAPKSYAVENSESWALRISRPLKLSEYLLFPLIVIFDRLTRIINRLMGSEGNFENAYVTRSEIQDMIETGEREGVLEADEHEMLQRILRFRNRIAKEVMVPRLDVVGVPAEASVEEAVDVAIESGYSRLPVYEGTLDDVVGVVEVNDLVDASGNGENLTARDVAIDPYIVPESKDVDEILTELREDRRRLAIVVDEFGTTAGIVTMEDIVEEIIGEVLGKTEQVPIRWLAENVVLVRGEVNVHEVNEALDIELPEGGEFESIAGFVFDRAGRLVEEGETVTHDGVKLVVQTAENNRILEVRVELPKEQVPDESDEQ
ncbi:hemolysin family protein [Natranaeroarchaeum sulfidigenes]|uniref:Hemolysins or related protein containing CBS domains n=1 Tax=Natranaeroarchaeum sulfidigenes TaxID=2784880 RepID=A0A897N1M9_9EURY|nr:hemolysin family protein [Natranaeroarchaeum sulfidigenes]QSG04236.1 Hemolysins or related protein containing CBS domains [Natranaeroarchaeum sulfidigenes]